MHEIHISPPDGLQSSVLPLEGCCQGAQWDFASSPAPLHFVCFCQGGRIPYFELRLFYL